MKDSNTSKHKQLVGVVASNKMDKSIVVTVQRLVKHPRYGKYVRRLTRCTAHDQLQQAQIGDTVKIVETRPLSKNKRWRLVEVVRKA